MRKLWHWIALVVGLISLAIGTGRDWEQAAWLVIGVPLVVAWMLVAVRLMRQGVLRIKRGASRL